MTMSSSSSIIANSEAPRDPERGLENRPRDTSLQCGGFTDNDSAIAQVENRDTDMMCKLIFILLGNASLYYWNALLNCIFDVIDQQYPDKSGMADILTGVYNTLCFATNVSVLIYGGGVHEWMIYSGLVVMAACSLGFCFIVQFSGGQTGYILLILLQIPAGIATGFVEGSAYAFSSILPKIYPGWVSFGQGISGILSFSVYMLFSECVFKGNVKGNVWVDLGISTFLILFALPASAMMFMTYKTWIGGVKDKQRNDESLSDQDKPMSWWNIFKATWGSQLNTCFTIWISLLLFPNVGPLEWGDNSSQTNTVMGMFQLGDFTGRYIPNMAKFLPFVMLSHTWLYVLSAARLLFIPFYTFCMLWGSAPWNNFGVHIVLMLTMAITSGWYLTLSLIYCPQVLERQVDRNRASALSVVLMLFGVSAGLWMAKLFTL